MAFNGSGTFLINTAGQPVVAGTVISSTAFNALTADLATGLSTVITKDGQTTVTANIPMSTYKFTGLGVGSAATDSANLSQVQSTVTKLLTSVSGTDTITAVGAPVVAAYAAGQMFYFVATGDNTGAVTLNIDALGAKAVTRDGSVALAAGDIKSGEVVVVVYDGTRFQVVSQLNSAGDARFANVSIASSLYVGGVSTFVGNAGFSANVSIASALSVGGVAAITGATTIGGNLTLNGGTANGVLYLNGSKVATSGSALTFDGTTLATTGKFGITGSGAVPTASALQIGTNAAGSRWLYNVPTGGEHNFTENGTVLSWQNISSLGWLIGGSEQMRLTSTGLGIGTASPGSKLEVAGAIVAKFANPDVGGMIVQATTGTNAAAMQFINTGGNGYVGLDSSTGSRVGGGAYSLNVWHEGNYPVVFGTNNTARARITSGGNLLVNKTTAEYGKFEVSSAEVWVSYFVNTKASGDTRGLRVSYSAASPNNTADWFLFCEDSTAQRASIRSNGGLANYQSNNADLSDARTKKDIAPAASMWGKVAALEIVAYKYNDQTHDDVNLGVIAQQVEAVEPVWVDNDGFGETPEGEEPLKTVYTKDITFAAIKALQEAMARIEKLEAEMAALKGA